MPLIVSIVRHGESTDNVKSLWAGHKDAPLSRHGMNQAKAIGKHFQEISFERIYCSDLKRAHWTAQQIHAHALNKAPGSLPAPIVDPLIREQFFGKAEGSSWTTGAHSHSGWPHDDKRKFRFEEGESLEDVARRADEFVNRVIKPWLLISSMPEYTKPPHICIVAHGITISELVRSILLLNPQQDPSATRLGSLSNTGFHRLQLTLDSSSKPSPQLIEDCRTALFASNETLPPLLDAFAQGLKMPVRVDVLAQQRDGHLSGIKRQTGGIGSSAYDEKQRDLKDFFGGGGGVRAAGKAAPSYDEDEIL